MLTRYARKDQEPVTDPRLASLLDAAAAPPEPGPASGEAAALAAFRSSSVAAQRRFRMHSPTTPLKSLAVAAASAGLLLTGGIAAANAGALPGAAQDTARTLLGSIGVDVPGADEHSAGHADNRGRSEQAPPTGDKADGADPESANSHGTTVSEVARSDESEGAEKGQAVSEAARTNGQAGQHGHPQAPEQSASGSDQGQAPAPAPADEGTGGASSDHAGVVTPNDGGTGTADDASADNGGAASINGTDRAGTASGGRSAAGSDNRP
ncbi:MAG TPA: hypothetical protein VFI99_04195 [Nocardioides sp.]|nr:hypothetical protein [Nocardioides sp.]